MVRHNFKALLNNLPIHAFLIISLFIILLPILYMVSTAFRPNQAILAPMIDFNTWTDANNTDKKLNRISKRKLSHMILQSMISVSPASITLEKALNSWIYSNGKNQSDFIEQFNIYAQTLPDDIRDDFLSIIYLNNNEMRYRYDVRVSLVNFKFFFTGNYSNSGGYNYPVKKWFYNSMQISSIVTFLQVFIVILAAFAISRFRFYGKKAIILLIVVLQIFPASMMMIAFYLMLDYLGKIVPSLGIDTIPGLILMYLGAGVPLNIWLAKSYFSTLPDSLEESAMIDGANYTQIFFYIIIPIITPIIAVIGILSFIATYNEFLLATFLITKPENLTLPVGLSFFMDGEIVRFGTFSAIAVIGSIPVLIIWLFFQKYIIAGLTHSSVKE